MFNLDCTPVVYCDVADDNGGENAPFLRVDAILTADDGCMKRRNDKLRRRGGVGGRWASAAASGTEWCSCDHETRPRNSGEIQGPPRLQAENVGARTESGYPISDRLCFLSIPSYGPKGRR